ncbi:phage terminase large subunit family protein, partial [Pseudoalteromonas fuliginea]|uniref:phage terminase large subunit family protein n=2 Tax=Pseudoalteromonas fuliginea TaxID=1872678 RepID=UPI0005194C3C
NDAETNGRKTGKTKDRLSWFGGGYGLFFGSNSPGKLRSFSIQYLFLDEVDGYKKSVGRDGSPVKLAIDRTAGYTQSKKVCMLSTPLEKGNSIIDDNYKL